MDTPDGPRTAAPDLDPLRLPDPAELIAVLGDALAGWLPGRRWYAHKADGPPEVSLAGWAPLRVRRDHAVLWTALRIRAGTAEALYQVPLVLAAPAEDGPEGGEPAGALVGTVPLPAGADGPARRLAVLDALLDDRGRAAVLDALLDHDGALGPGLRLAVTGPADRAALPGGPGSRSRVLGGEQSNTSIVVEDDSGVAPVIVKVFRVLQDGLNPDVELQAALSAAGSTRVPPVLGAGIVAVDGRRTHALVAQEFLPGVEDAWRTSLRDAAQAAADGTDAGTGSIRDLGAAVAEVHADLARVLGTTPADAGAVAGTVARMRARVAEVAAAVPAVAAHRDALEGLLAAAADAPWPALQRVHGDLHLGQVLADPTRGWVLLDFEGEPLRPLAERSLPDTPWRDVAGMLRSLDYVSGALASERGLDAGPWTARARAEFLAGYAERAGLDPEEAGLRTVLAALEADKAVYEAYYEARNRPDWLPIPLGALERLSAAAAPRD